MGADPPAPGAMSSVWLAPAPPTCILFRTMLRWNNDRFRATLRFTGLALPLQSRPCRGSGGFV